MRDDHYPPGTVTVLLETDLVTEPTRQVLQARLLPLSATPRFFEPTTFALLDAVSKLLVPQPPHLQPVDLAARLDAVLLTGVGKGWRYDRLPPDKEAFALGLQGVEEAAMLLFDRGFIILAASEQIAVLTAVQNELAPGTIWQRLPAKRFFEELLAALVELYYAHPFGQEAIGVVAMADKQGWQQIGLDALETHEPLVLKEQTYGS